MTTWQSQSQKAQTHLSASIPPDLLIPSSALPPTNQKDVTDFPRQSGLFTPAELAITESSATRLVDEMAAGRLSAEEVLRAFLRRGVVGQQLFNFATEFMAEKAIARAKELDGHFRRTGKVVGPLHGIPISVKEHIGMKGRPCNAGYVAWVDQKAPEDALLLQHLSAAGAIFHVRTNQPQSLMHLDCTNNLTGTTRNPHNRHLSPGGSSGGEGASTGFKCAPLGVGTDIGGSIRAPAAFCGSYGFKPSSGRNPGNGIIVPFAGQESVKGVIGPLAANSIQDLGLFQAAVLDARPWEKESALVPMPWRRVGVEGVRRMRVGVLWDDGCVRPHPPVTRALRDAVSRLEKAGVTVVPWESHKHDHGWEIISKLYFPDAAQTQHALLSASGEPILPLTTWSFNYSSSTPLTIPQNWALNVARDIYRDEYTSLFGSRGVDFILCPTYPGPAAKLGDAQYWNYTAIWNILDLPAVSFPSGVVVDRNVDVDDGYTPRNEVDAREWRKYDPELSHGAPIGLQIVGGRWKDEETLAAAEVVEGIIRGSGSGDDGGKARF